jgi:hypothetical protein
VENPLSLEILKGNVKDGDTVALDKAGDGIGFSVGEKKGETVSRPTG